MVLRGYCCECATVWSIVAMVRCSLVMLEVFYLAGADGVGGVDPYSSRLPYNSGITGMQA